MRMGTAVLFLWQGGVMTDLHDLIPADSPLFLAELLEALGINDRGQIVGYAFDPAAHAIRAFLATPVSGSESAPLAAQGQTSKRPKVVLPQKVRKMLRERMARRYPYRGFGASPRD